MSKSKGKPEAADRPYLSREKERQARAMNRNDCLEPADVEAADVAKWGEATWGEARWPHE